MNKKMWSIEDKTWMLQFHETKTEATKFVKQHGFVVVGEAYGENNKPHKFLLKGTFKTISAAKRWAKENSFEIIKD